MFKEDDYDVRGKVLDKTFTFNLYSFSQYTEEDIIERAAYLFSYGNYSCDCAKGSLIGIDDIPCGDNIEYQELYLCKNASKIYNLLDNWWFNEEM